MRFVPSSCLKPGMVLSHDLYGYQNELMLSKGQVLSQIEINRIRELKYQGAYINDKLSEDIQVDGIISSKLKNNTVRALKDVFEYVGDGVNVSEAADFGRIKHLIDDIISEITTNKNAAVNMMDLKVFDDYTYYHSVNVAAISIVVGLSAGLSKTGLYQLGLGALLHDIGKVFVPKDILDKPGKLTVAEYDEIKKHSLLGSEYLREKWEVPIESNITVLTHHEKYDGSGYPYGLKSDKVPELGKIVAVADVYDALTSDRPYRRGMLPSDAMEYVMGGSGIMFDPKVVEMFTRKIVPYPVGTCITLSNGRTGIVIENNSNCCMRPKIRIVSDSEEETVLDLYNDRELLNVTIVGVANI